MTREQEEVIAAGRRYVAHWGDVGCEAEPPYGPLYRAVRALEESEKPKPKVWTLLNSTELRCSDGRYISVAAIGNTGGAIDEWSHRVAVGFLVRALNLLERCGEQQQLATCRAVPCCCAICNDFRKSL